MGYLIYALLYPEKF
ncbi:MAG: K(+)-transporting ATPase subunit F, partial [Deltaproteobacteria bacterium]|nr:K(+)-transporting ATPase subunit F [Deltaproteobacteria bacterium]